MLSSPRQPVNNCIKQNTSTTYKNWNALMCHFHTNDYEMYIIFIGWTDAIESIPYKLFSLKIEQPNKQIDSKSFQEYILYNKCE